MAYVVAATYRARDGEEEKIREILEIRETRHGPILTSYMIGIADPVVVEGGIRRSYALRWVGLEHTVEPSTIHRLDRRFALWVLSRRGVASSTSRIVVAMGGTAALLSSVISNTAAVAMLLPITLGVLDAVDGGAPAMLADGVLPASPSSPPIHALTIAVATRRKESGRAATARPVTVGRGGVTRRSVARSPRSTRRRPRSSGRSRGR